MLNKVQLKICGMRDPINIRAVGAVLPHYMGFIFYKDSPRYVGEDFQLPDNLPASIKRVGVFVNESVEYILELCKKYELSLVQLHGDEPVSVCRKLKQQELRVIKVFQMGEVFDFSVLNPYKPVVDYFLFDTKGKYYGGNAIAFDWKILERYDQEIPFFLSGGLNPENIKGIAGLSTMNLHAIDLNSGVEAAPGVKDVIKISTVIKNVRAIQF
jgi:phosphoribosylanthranilate isomerase